MIYLFLVTSIINNNHVQNSMNWADDVERVGIIRSPDLALPPSFSMKCHPTSIIFCDYLAIKLNQTLANAIKPDQRSIAFDFSNFLWEFDCVRLPNPIERNHMIEFDWVRLNLINRMFDLVWLVTSGRARIQRRRLRWKDSDPSSFDLPAYVPLPAINQFMLSML